MRSACWALALACLSVAGALAAPAKPTAPPRTPDLLAAGKAAYTASCAACHGATGEGNGPVAFALDPKPRNFVKDAFKAGDSVEAVFHTITYGLAGTKMVGYPQLPERDRWGLAYYVLAFRATKK